MKQILFLTMSTLVLHSTAQTPSKDEAVIHGAVQMMEDGWNAKSGEMFSRPFAPIHDYVVVNGLYFANQTLDQNAKAHQGIFNSIYRTTDLKLIVDKIKFIREDLALVHILGGTYEKGSATPAHPGAIVTGLFEKQADGWKIISFHNCNIEVSFEPGDRSGSPVPLNVLYASWYKSE